MYIFVFWKGWRFLQELCQQYLQLLDELQHLMKKAAAAGFELGEQMVEDLDWRIAVLLAEIKQLEQVILNEV